MSNDQIGPLSEIQVNVTQRMDGTISGTWSGKATPDATCPPDLGSAPTGSVNGVNTVLEVRFSLVGAGIFDGQAIDAETLQGSLESCGSYPIKFSRTDQLP